MKECLYCGCKTKLKFCCEGCAKEFRRSQLPQSKICLKCNVLKPITDFTISKTVYVQPNCKQCVNDHQTARSRDLKEKAVKYKGGSCELCGYSKCIEALEFHHRDPSIKEFAISKYTGSFDEDREKICAELDKCSLLCSNCHKEEHYRLRQ